MTQIERHTQVWRNCLLFIEQIVPPQHFATWFKPIRPVSLVEATLTVEVPSDFFREYIETTFLDVIRRALKKELGTGARLIYQIRPVSNQPDMKIPAQEGTVPVNKPVTISTSSQAGTPGAFIFPGLTKIRIDSRLNPIYRFSNMVEGACNKMGITAGENISAKPGKTPFNPLFIFGGPGLGKTHLAQAIGLSIKEQYPDLVVLYVTGNEFKNQYVDAVFVRNKLTDFLAFYMKIDVLIVDDIQDLAGQGSQTAFFNVFNHLHQSGKQLIFTSDRAPVDLQNFEDRLLSRFKWGLSVELRTPDYATRLSMLKARCEREGVMIGSDVLEYLASHVKASFRELEGALISVIAHATMTHQENSVELAASITEKIVSEDKNELNIDRVQTAVCDYFNITRDEIVSRSRKRQIVQARQIAMYLSRNLISNCSLATIGAEIGGKDHATVLHACSTVSDLMATDKSFKKYVTDLESMLVPNER